MLGKNGRKANNNNYDLANLTPEQFHTSLFSTHPRMWYSSPTSRWPQLFSASLTCVGRLWRSRHNTMDAILFQWHVSEWLGILQLLRILTSNRFSIHLVTWLNLMVFFILSFMSMFSCLWLSHVKTRVRLKLKRNVSALGGPYGGIDLIQITPEYKKCDISLKKC